nr:fatty acid synthase [Helicoverpa armigera]XP_049699196.1 fatty acid synthase [Helicoverpa armigera]
MAPTPQEHVSTHEGMLAPDASLGDLDGERIVITGMSGLYPKSHNVQEFSKILYSKENPITSEGLRWNYKHPDLAQYTGMAPDLDRFDAQFFSVHFRLGNYMDPMSRKILEQAYQAIYDAGLSPAHLNGKKVAVFVGSSFSDTEKSGSTDIVSKSGLGILGSSKTMFANRISYWLNTKGPSLAIDEADCSATTALEEAYLALKRGACEAAIVGGAYLSLQPQASVHHARLSATVSKDGTTKSFAQNADGYVLSDAISVILLQKSKDAKRVYAELVHVKNEFLSIMKDTTGTGPRFGYCRNPLTVAGFIKEFYKEAQVPPQAVEYVEGYGTGVPEGDKAELEAIEEVYCKDREDPLLVGSVTSNIGLTEAAAGMTALTKVLLGYHHGAIAANLHCDSPRQDVAALRDGRMQVVTDNKKFQRNYVALNGMSAAGVNSHVLLKGKYKPKDLSLYKSSIPHLVTISGRQESAIRNIFENLTSRPIDAEELALLHNIHANNISGHLGRGYVILGTNEFNETVSLAQKSEYFDDARRPLWFVYSGMGSQWVGMGTQLMRIPIFAAAIERCHKVLHPEGIDIVSIITSTDPKTFDNILHSFVGIAAIQIGLTDVLRALGLKPDGIIGHSVGELGCAYADGCLTAEEMILCAYGRGLVSLNTDFILGSMAAVGLGFEQVSKICPPEIDVACHNGPDSSTISGPADVMKEFVAQLTAKGVFAKEVPCSNKPYHSRYIAKAAPALLKFLKGTIKNPKARSERWLSTSIPQEKWNEELATYCSAEYHTNNLLSPVLFDETIRLLPGNAVLVEVAPHGLLQAILKRAMPAEARHVPLTRRGHADNALFLLQAVGDLYMHGYTPEVQALYPKVEFPVSTETPMLSHLVQWNHSEKWRVTSFVGGEKRAAAACQFVKSIHDDEYTYLQGHVVREKRCYPFAAALVDAWDTLAMHLDVGKRNGTVQFRDVHLYAQPTLHDQRPLRLSVALHRGDGRFEVMNESFRVASGYIFSNPAEDEAKQDVDSGDLVLSSKNVYQLLKERDYNYSGEFCSIEACDTSLSSAALVWRDNWVTFLDGLLQLNMLRQPHHAVTLPTHIRRLDIDTTKHNEYSYTLNGKTVVNANVSDVFHLTRCGGVELQNIQYRDLPSVSQDIRRVDLVVPSAKQKLCGSQNGGVKNEVTLQCAQIGNLDSLQWVETAAPLDDSGVVVKVHYAGLSTSDVRAVGKMSCNTDGYGMDYSGVTQDGVRVMGLVRGGAASSVVRAQSQLLWPMPVHWSLEDAATVPLAYAHAFYCLGIKLYKQLTPETNLFVHGGAGSFGQAIISIALAYGCTVFTTVSDIKKKRFLLNLFPELKAENIGNSRDHSFGDMVLQATKGRGCDIVISSAKGDLKTTTLNCGGNECIFLDISQLHNQDEDYDFGMYNLTKERGYAVVDFSSIFLPEKIEEVKKLQKMLSEGIRLGYVRPLSRVTYAPHEAARAFRLLAASRHRGRVLLKIQGSVNSVYPRIICNPNECQAMFWDEGALGVQLAERLIERGARKLYIQSKNLTQYEQYKIGTWKKLGADVIVSENNINGNTLVKDASSIGTLGGIYVAITNVSNDKVAELGQLIKSIDSSARSICPHLQYFAILSAIKSLGQDICVDRAKCGFAATHLDLSELYQAQSKASSHDVVDVAERALRSPSPVVAAVPVPVNEPSLLQQLIALSKIQIPQNVDPEATLKDLGLVAESIPLICSFLDVVYNVSLDEDSIPDLTLKGIQELVETATDIVPENVNGLATFFSKVSADELIATTELFAVPTLNKDITLSEDEFDVNKRYLCIVPGMEGHYERFQVLCERLKLPAFVLQPGYDRPRETIRETAERYAKILLKKTGIQNNFYLLGYEIGVLVALELTAILEDHGLTGTVFCLGCAPEEFQATLEEQLSSFKTEEQLQDAIIRHMSKLITDEDVPALDDILSETATWSEKVAVCTRSLLGRMQHSVQYAQAQIESALGNISRGRAYVAPVRALRSQLVLLRAANCKPAARALQQHSQRPVAVHQLRTPLSYVSNDMECPAIINRYLDDEIKTEFEMKNLCEAYSLYKDLF